MKPFEITHDLQADKSLRLANFVIDYIVYLAFCSLIGIAIGILSTILGMQNVLDYVATMGTLHTYFWGGILFIIAFFPLEAMTSRTIGKFITGTIVVDENGEKPETRAFFIRTICRLIPFEVFSFLGDRGWHDSISRTYVVKKKIFLERKNTIIELDEIGENSEII